MREAERREQAALDYAKGVEEKRQVRNKFEKTDSDYVKKFETSIQSGLEAAQKELAAAIEAGDARLKLRLTKELQRSHLRMQNLSKLKKVEKKSQAEKPVNLNQGGKSTTRYGRSY